MLVVKINHLTIVWFKARSPFVLKHTTSLYGKAFLIYLTWRYLPTGNWKRVFHEKMQYLCEAAGEETAFNGPASRAKKYLGPEGGSSRCTEPPMSTQQYIA